MLPAWAALKSGANARFVDEFMVGGGGWDGRFWMLNSECVLILHGLTCDTLAHAVEIPIRKMLAQGQ